MLVFRVSVHGWFLCVPDDRRRLVATNQSWSDTSGWFLRQNLITEEPENLAWSGTGTNL